MPKYQTKVRLIEAKQFTNEDELPDRVEYQAGNYYFKTHGGLLHIAIGDWIVEDDIIISDKEFKSLYEEVPNG